jgi:hypothetical protein
MNSKWYWFGVLVDGAGHVKLRQYHARVFSHDSFICESWSRGIDCKLWYVRRFQERDGNTLFFDTLAEAVAAIKAEIATWAHAYVVVEEGEPPRPDFSQTRATCAGGADPNWWAAVLRVNETCGEDEVRSAFRARAMETHPDRGGDADEFRRVFAAWEYVKEVRGWR